MSSDQSVIALTHSVEMLGLRIQYLQCMITALAGAQIVNDRDFLKSGSGIKSDNPARDLKN
ncbi:MAG: hypothetical protein V1897_01635 [Pseudomonadota bacterium]